MEHCRGNAPSFCGLQEGLRGPCPRGVKAVFRTVRAETVPRPARAGAVGRRKQHPASLSPPPGVCPAASPVLLAAASASEKLRRTFRRAGMVSGEKGDAPPVGDNDSFTAPVRAAGRRGCPCQPGAPLSDTVRDGCNMPAGRRGRTGRTGPPVAAGDRASGTPPGRW